MNKTWMPIAAGILEIMAGFWMLISTLYFLGFALLEARGSLWENLSLRDWIEGMIPFIISLLGVVALVGGVFALLSRKWGLALAGAIATVPLFLVARFGLRWFIDYPYFEPTPPIFYLNLVSPLLLSIVIITLLVLSKREFR